MPDNMTFDDIIDSATESLLYGGSVDAEDLWMDPEYFSNLDDAENPADDLWDDILLDSINEVS